METAPRNIVADALDYVFNVKNIYKKEQYLGGRVMNGKTFGHLKASLRMQYCMGGYFIQGWGGNTKFRIYGLTTPVITEWRLHVADMEAVINEQDESLSFEGVGKEDLFQELKEFIINGY